jgi:ribosomal protein L37E
MQDKSHMKCKRCGEYGELERMVATINGEARYLCQRCGEMD